MEHHLTKRYNRFDSASRDSVSARLPTFFSNSSRCFCSWGDSSSKTRFKCAVCTLNSGTNMALPFGVSETVRTRRSDSLSTRLTSPFLCSRSTATLTDPGFRSTFGPIVLTGIGPWCNRTLRTLKSEFPKPLLSMGGRRKFVIACRVFNRMTQVWMASGALTVFIKNLNPRSV